MAEKKAAKKLSPSWVEASDPTTGKVYYANIVTKETSWTKPADAIKKELEEQKNRASKKKKKDVWLERQDPNTGRLYYYNPAKKETSWHRPENIISSDAVQADDHMSAWVERQDPRSGRPYYYNPVLGKTSWTNPAQEEEAMNSMPQKEQSALKRLSTSIGNVAADAGKRLSMGMSRLSFGTSNLNRNSARYSMSEPALPVNKNVGRASLRLAGFDMSGGKSIEQAIAESSEHDDKFAKLRAMKNQGMMPKQKEASLDLEQKLKIDIMAEAEQIVLDVPFKDFGIYAREYFSLRKKGMFGGNLDLTTVRCFQRTPLSQPLHELNNKDLNADALYAFRTILRYCGEIKSKKDLNYHARLFLSYGNGTAAELQAELYSQLVKQTTNNPGQLSEERAWELLALTAGTYKPPPAIELFIQSHLKQASDTPPSQTIKKLSDYAILRLSKIENLGPRLEVPSEKEISSSRSIQPVNIKINLVSSTSINMQVDTWTTIRDVRSALEYRFQIKDGSPFAVFEVSDDDHERVLDDGDRVLDVIAYWQRIIDQKTTKTYAPEFQFLFKIRLFFDISEDDTAAVELAYLQAVYEVLDQRYPCTEEDCIILSALEAQEKFGDFNGSDVFGDKLGAYLPSKFYRQEDEEEIKRRIYSHYKNFSGYDKLLCMVNYLNYVKGWKYYGSAYYFADPITLKLLGKTFPKTVIIGINAKGILIIDPQTLDLIAEYPYSELVTWGHSAQNFVFVVGNLVRSQKLFFKTTDGLEMNSLIHAYVQKLMEAQPVEGMADIQDGQDDYNNAFNNF